jgi:hypothetical protein
MGGMTRGFRPWLGGAVAVSALCIVSASAFAQNRAAQSAGTPPDKVAGGFDKVKVLPPGGPAPRMSDGHVDLTGRWYPNPAGRMLQFAYPVDGALIRQFDPAATPELPPVFKPGLAAKYRAGGTDTGECEQAGTPNATMTQINQHAPMEMIETPARLTMLYEYPMDVRMIYMNGRQHPKDPDPTFNGDSTAHWDGDTLVIDVIAIDTRLRNQGAFTSRVSNPTLPQGGPAAGGAGGAGAQGFGGGWFHSEQEHVTERITRTSKNLLTWQITVEDPVVLAQPFKTAPRVWSLAAPGDEWGEVFCTLNQEPEEDKKIRDYQEQQKGK